jgi:iron complex transport system ATP-binding protein
MTGLLISDVRIDRGARTVVRNVSGTVEGGAVLALIGPNGAGKSTLIRAMAALVPAGCTIRLNGCGIADLAPAERARRIAYLPQALEAAWPISVREVAALGFLPRGRRVEHLTAADRDALAARLETLGLSALADRRLDSLSGGEQARAHLARALVTDADLLLLDEPFAALDPGWQIDVATLLRAEAAKGRIVVASLHDLNAAARLADQVWLMRDGALVAAGPPEAVLSAAPLAAAFGVRMAEATLQGQRIVVPTGRLSCDGGLPRPIDR